MIKKVCILFIFFISFNSTMAQYASWPIGSQDVLNSTFGSRNMPGRVNNYDFHGGIDIKGYAGDNVYAATDGIIPDGGISTESETAEQKGYVVVKHEGNGFTDYYRYTHITPNSSLSVGSTVKRGDLIGTIHSYVSWGPHLDFRYYWDNAHRNSSVHPLQILENYNNSPVNEITGTSVIQSDADGHYIEITISSPADAPDFEWIILTLNGTARSGFSYNQDEILRGDLNANQVDFHNRINCGDGDVNNSDHGLVYNAAGDLAIHIVTQNFNGVDPQVLKFKFYLKDEFVDVNDTYDRYLEQLTGSVEIWDCLETPARIDNINFLQQPSQGSVSFDPPPGTYPLSPNENFIVTMTSTQENFNWIIYNTASSSDIYPATDVTINNFQYYGQSPQQFMFSTEPWRWSPWEIKAAGATRGANGRFETGSEQTVAVYNFVERTTGIEDGILITQSYDEIYANTFWGFQSTFIDNDPTGNHLIEGPNGSLIAFTVDGGGYTVPGGPTYFSELPTDYCWKRNSSGNVEALVVVSGTDNDGVFHQSTHPVVITNVQPSNSYSIAGYVKDASATPVSSVTLTFGTDGGTVATDANGYYSKTFSCGWSGTVTPTKTGYTFDPVSRPYDPIVADQTEQNYTAALSSVTISGNVSIGGSPLQDVTITYNPGGSVTTDASGNYSFEVNYGWSGTITPSKTNYNFAPGNIPLSNVTSNQTNQNFTATPQFINISGAVTAGGSPLQGVTITYTGGNVSTDSSRNYSFINYMFLLFIDL